MGLLDQLWDDTVAGPQPEKGLSRIRKFSKSVTTPGKDSGKGDVKADGRSVERSLSGKIIGETDDHHQHPAATGEAAAHRVTRSIMIVRSQESNWPAGGSRTDQDGTPPGSPAGGSTPPVSPLSSFFGVRSSGRSDEMGGGDEVIMSSSAGSRLRRKSMSDAYNKNQQQQQQQIVLTNLSSASSGAVATSCDRRN